MSKNSQLFSFSTSSIAQAVRVALIAAQVILATGCPLPDRPVGPPPRSAPEGTVNFYQDAGSSFDRYINGSDGASNQNAYWNFMTQHQWGLTAFEPYGNQALTHVPIVNDYFDTYAIYNGGGGIFSSTTHPEWILRDAANNMLFIPWGCSGGTCPQYAADIGNPAFRSAWVNEAKRIFARGYSGFWIDDVNMEFNVSNGSGTLVAPKDPRTGASMTWQNWRKYMAEFMEYVRTELPSAMLIHNALWFSLPSGVVGEYDPYIDRQIAASDYFFIEHGFNDGGITGGTGKYSLDRLMKLIDHIHTLGAGVMSGSLATDATGREFALGCYFLISNGNDWLSDSNHITPTSQGWWSALDTDLGAAQAARFRIDNSVNATNKAYRRNFAKGIVIVNPPGAGSVTVNLGGTYKNLAGSWVTSVTLSARQAAVLKQ